jgi:hypothetical protein
MPTSGHAQISLVLELVNDLKPRSVLEVGTGWGKYGVLCREYLGRAARIEGIEGYAPYVGPIHRAAYDEVHIGDAREILPAMQTRFDLALMIDVFEHLTRDDGARVLAELDRLAGATLLSVPATWDPQDGGEENAFQTHRAQYYDGDFTSRGWQVWRMADHLICLRSEQHIDLRPVVARWCVALLAPQAITRTLVRLRDRVSGNSSLAPP